MNPASIEGIPGALLLDLVTQGDERGFFREILREDAIGAKFVQANHSNSRRGVLRGLHYHRRQADAWYVVSGRIQAVLADLRTQGVKPVVASIELSVEEPRVLYIPPGVAHGFLALSDVEMIYWVTEYYDASDEFGIAWNDPQLEVPWKVQEPILSERDKANPALEWESIGRFS